MENETLKLLEPPPEHKLASWLQEFYGKSVKIKTRELLRHRDLSLVERLDIEDAVPSTIIYKVVLPPWDIEKDLHEHVLIPAVSNSPRLYLSGNYQAITAMFLEDMGKQGLLQGQDKKISIQLGTELARLHRAFTYRIAEIQETRVLRCLLPENYMDLAKLLGSKLQERKLGDKASREMLNNIMTMLAQNLASEPVSLVHGDFYAENIICNDGKLHVIDWSWFTIVGVSLMDLATIASDHFKNGSLYQYKDEIIEAYCTEYSRDEQEVRARLPYALLLSRVFFLHWLVERRTRGIMGTTVGPVDDLIVTVLKELGQQASKLS